MGVQLQYILISFQTKLCYSRNMCWHLIDSMLKCHMKLCIFLLYLYLKQTPWKPGAALQTLQKTVWHGFRFFFFIYTKKASLCYGHFSEWVVFAYCWSCIVQLYIICNSCNYETNYPMQPWHVQYYYVITQRQVLMLTGN